MKTHKITVRDLIETYWKFDDNQQPVSNWHDKQDLLKELEKEIKFKYILQITPYQADRPRGSAKTGRFYNTPAYTLYKGLLLNLLKGKNITIDGRKVFGIKVPKDTYNHLEAVLYKPYPKSTAKYKLIEGQIRLVKPDWDNEAKALQDAMERARILDKDSQVYKGNIEQRYTTEAHGRIEFNLYKDEEL